MTKQQKYSRIAYATEHGADAPKHDHERRKYQSARVRKYYLNNREAAEYLCVSESFLNKTRHFGTGPRFYRVGRAIRYAEVDLDDWMAEHCATSTRDRLK